VKLLLYSHYFAPSIGGVETIVESLARGLAGLRASDGEKEFCVTVVTQTPAGALPDDALPYRVVRRPGFLQLCRLIRAAGLVHLAGPALLPLLWSVVTRKPVVIEHHGFQTICPSGQLFYEPSQSPCPGHFMAGRDRECLRCTAAEGATGAAKLWLLTFLRRFLSKHAAANIMPTHWLGGVLALPRVETILHGLDTSREPLVRNPVARPVIVFQGRLVATKGVRVLLEAARILHTESRTFELHIIGDGAARRTLEQFVAAWELAQQVRFLGSLPASELDAQLAQASVVVIPSLGGEVFGLVAAENMLRGLPVVASDLGAFLEVLGDAGMTFRTGDAADLARRLAELLRDPGGAASLGVRGRARALEFFSRERMIEAHASLYRNLCVSVER
jgi:glycogen(starch) synthase